MWLDHLGSWIPSPFKCSIRGTMAHKCAQGIACQSSKTTDSLMWQCEYYLLKFQSSFP